MFFHSAKLSLARSVPLPSVENGFLHQICPWHLVCASHLPSGPFPSSIFRLVFLMCCRRVAVGDGQALVGCFITPQTIYEKKKEQ